MLFHLQNRVSVFETLIFSQNICRDVHYVREIKPYFLNDSDKSLSSPVKKQIKRNLRHGFVDKRQLKAYIVAFYSSDLVHFFKFPFKVLIMSVFSTVNV